MPRPSIHKLAPPNQRVGSTVGLFGLVADDVLGKLAGNECDSAFGWPA